MNRTAVPLLLATLLGFLAATGCVDPGPPDTGGTILYAYDDTSHSVLAWNDVNTIYDLGAGSVAPAADRTITGDDLTSLDTLAWGGMVVDYANNRLYLVSETGTVVRIENVRTQNGALSQITDIVTFQLGTSDSRLESSKFGQASVNANGTLYVTETGSSDRNRIWVVSNASSIANLSTLTSGSFISPALNDVKCYGMSASSGGVFAFFADGNQVIDTSDPTTFYSGPRLRFTSGSSFDLLSNVVVGPATLLGQSSNITYGSLAFDPNSTRLYLARNIASGNAVVVFSQSSFSFTNPAPAGVLPDTITDVPELRVLAHARTKDWLVGADNGTSGAGTNVLRIWKAPSTGATASLPFTLGLTGAAIKGLALDGSQ